MTIVIKELYDALIDCGCSPEKATKAANVEHYRPRQFIKTTTSKLADWCYYATVVIMGGAIFYQLFIRVVN